MSYADQVFISMCEDILENGTSTFNINIFEQGFFTNP